MVYALYLLFQLKSHAYMYASTPQEIIDEESHPGLLAMLGHSSSSDSSDTLSSTDSDESSGSHTTAKRIRRAFRNRRRRKSSFSSTTATPSVPSVISFPTTETHQSYFEPNRNYFEQEATAASDRKDESRKRQTAKRQTATRHAIMSGDEADTEVERVKAANRPRVRDFETEKGESLKSGERRHKKKSKRFQRKALCDEQAKPELSEKEALQHADGKAGAMDDAQEPRVGFSDEVQTAPSSRRPFTLQRLSTRPAFRPALDKMLSNNVFSAPPPLSMPLSGAPTPGASMNKSAGIRRTTSLPDRLNLAHTVVSAPSGPLPPYPTQVRVVEKAKSKDEPKPQMSRTAALVLLVISTGLVALCAEFLVGAIPKMIADSSVSPAFIGLIILPIVGNAAEHITAVTVAAKNKMDLAIGVAVGSSIQIGEP